MAEPKNEEFREAKLRSEVRLRGPRAESAFFDEAAARIVVRLTTGAEIRFLPGDLEGLQHVSAEELGSIEVQEFGLGIHFSQARRRFSCAGAGRGVLGSREWMATRLGAAGGRNRSSAKAAASWENGKRGGRPRDG